MGTLRFFSGGRDDDGKKSIAKEMMRFEVQKGARMDAQERFKFIMDRKLAENRKKVQNAKMSSRPMSARAEKALKDIAAKKAAKQAKELRKMVIITPKTYMNGKLTKKGELFDIAGNRVGRVQKKDGKMYTYLGSFLGMYKPKAAKTHHTLQNAINQWSPHFINLRKMQERQAAGLDPKTGLPLNPEAMHVYGDTGGHGASTLYGAHNHGGGGDTVYGNGSAAYAMHGGLYRPQGTASYFKEHFRPPSYDGEDGDLFGDSANGYVKGASIGLSVYGTMSNNVWGNYADNAWGTSLDNVHGTNQQDIWGHATGGSPYASFGKTTQFWGTGNGVNYLNMLITKISQLFGINNSYTRAAIHAMKAARTGSGSAHRPTRATHSTHTARSYSAIQETRSSRRSSGGPTETRSSRSGRSGRSSGSSSGPRVVRTSSSSGSRSSGGPRVSAGASAGPRRVR